MLEELSRKLKSINNYGVFFDQNGEPIIFINSNNHRVTPPLFIGQSFEINIPNTRIDKIRKDFLSKHQIVKLDKNNIKKYLPDQNQQRELVDLTSKIAAIYTKVNFIQINKIDIIGALRKRTLSINIDGEFFISDKPIKYQDQGLEDRIRLVLEATDPTKKSDLPLFSLASLTSSVRNFLGGLLFNSSSATSQDLTRTNYYQQAASNNFRLRGDFSKTTVQDQKFKTQQNSGPVINVGSELQSRIDSTLNSLSTDILKDGFINIRTTTVQKIMDAVVSSHKSFASVVDGTKIKRIYLKDISKDVIRQNAKDKITFYSQDGTATSFAYLYDLRPLTIVNLKAGLTDLNEDIDIFDEKTGYIIDTIRKCSNITPEQCPPDISFPITNKTTTLTQTNSPTNTATLTQTDSNTLTLTHTLNPTLTQVITITGTDTATPTATLTVTNSATDSRSPSVTYSHTLTPEVSKTISQSLTTTISDTKTLGSSNSVTVSLTPTATASDTATGTASESEQQTTSNSVTATISNSISEVVDQVTQSVSNTATLTQTDSNTLTLTHTLNPTLTQVITITGTDTATPTATLTVTNSATDSRSPSVTYSHTLTPEVSKTISQSLTTTISDTKTLGSSNSVTVSLTPTATASDTATGTASESEQQTTSNSVTATISNSISEVVDQVTQSVSNTATLTQTDSNTLTLTHTLNPTLTQVITITGTDTATPTATLTVTNSATDSRSPSVTYSHTLTPEVSKTISQSLTTTISDTKTLGSSNSVTVSLTPTATASDTATGTASESEQQTTSNSVTATISNSISEVVDQVTQSVSNTATLTQTDSNTLTLTHTLNPTLTQVITITGTDTATPTATLTVTNSATDSRSPSVTYSHTLTPEVSKTISQSLTTTISDTKTLGSSNSVTVSLTPTATASDTATGTASESEQQTTSNSVTATISNSISEVVDQVTQSVSNTATLTQTDSNTLTLTHTLNPTLTQVITITGTDTATPTATLTVTNSATDSRSPSVTYSHTLTPEVSKTISQSLTTTISDTKTLGSSNSVTVSLTPTATASDTATGTASESEQQTTSNSVTATISNSISEVVDQVTQSVSNTATLTQTDSNTLTLTHTLNPTLTQVITITGTDTATPTATLTVTNSATDSRSPSVTYSHTLTPEVSKTISQSLTTTISDTKTLGSSNSVTVSLTPTATASDTATGTASESEQQTTSNSVTATISNSISEVVDQVTQSVSNTATLTQTDSNTLTLTHTLNPTLTQVITITGTDTATPTATLTVTNSATDSRSPSVTYSHTLTPEVSKTISQSLTTTISDTKTLGSSNSVTVSLTPTATASDTATGTASESEQQTTSNSVTATISNSISEVVDQVTQSVSNTATLTQTDSNTLTLSSKDYEITSNITNHQNTKTITTTATLSNQSDGKLIEITATLDNQNQNITNVSISHDDKNITLSKTSSSLIEQLTNLTKTGVLDFDSETLSKTATITSTSSKSAKLKYQSNSLTISYDDLTKPTLTITNTKSGKSGELILEGESEQWPIIVGAVFGGLIICCCLTFTALALMKVNKEKNKRSEDESQLKINDIDDINDDINTGLENKDSQIRQDSESSSEKTPTLLKRVVQKDSPEFPLRPILNPLFNPNQPPMMFSLTPVDNDPSPDGHIRTFSYEGTPTLQIGVQDQKLTKEPWNPWRNPQALDLQDDNQSINSPFTPPDQEESMDRDFIIRDNKKAGLVQSKKLFQESIDEKTPNSPLTFLSKLFKLEEDQTSIDLSVDSPQRSPKKTTDIYRSYGSLDFKSESPWSTIEEQQKTKLTPKNKTTSSKRTEVNYPLSITIDQGSEEILDEDSKNIPEISKIQDSKVDSRTDNDLQDLIEAISSYSKIGYLPPESTLRRGDDDFDPKQLRDRTPDPSRGRGRMAPGEGNLDQRRRGDDDFDLDVTDQEVRSQGRSRGGKIVPGTERGLRRGDDDFDPKQLRDRTPDPSRGRGRMAPGEGNLDQRRRGDDDFDLDVTDQEVRSQGRSRGGKIVPGTERGLRRGDDDFDPKQLRDRTPDPSRGRGRVAPGEGNLDQRRRGDDDFDLDVTDQEVRSQGRSRGGKIVPGTERGLRRGDDDFDPKQLRDRTPDPSRGRGRMAPGEGNLDQRRRGDDDFDLDVTDQEVRSQGRSRGGKIVPGTERGLRRGDDSMDSFLGSFDQDKEEDKRQQHSNRPSLVVNNSAHGEFLRAGDRESFSRDPNKRRNTTTQLTEREKHRGSTAIVSGEIPDALDNFSFGTDVSGYTNSSRQESQIPINPNSRRRATNTDYLTAKPEYDKQKRGSLVPIDHEKEGSRLPFEIRQYHSFRTEATLSEPPTPQSLANRTDTLSDLGMHTGLTHTAVTTRRSYRENIPTIKLELPTTRPKIISKPPLPKTSISTYEKVIPSGERDDDKNIPLEEKPLIASHGRRSKSIKQSMSTDMFQPQIPDSEPTSLETKGSTGSKELSATNVQGIEKEDTGSSINLSRSSISFQRPETNDSHDLSSIPYHQYEPPKSEPKRNPAIQRLRLGSAASSSNPDSTNLTPKSALLRKARKQSFGPEVRSEIGSTAYGNPSFNRNIALDDFINPETGEIIHHHGGFETEVVAGSLRSRHSSDRIDVLSRPESDSSETRGRVTVNRSVIRSHRYETIKQTDNGPDGISHQKQEATSSARNLGGDLYQFPKLSTESRYLESNTGQRTISSDTSPNYLNQANLFQAQESRKAWRIEFEPGSPVGDIESEYNPSFDPRTALTKFGFSQDDSGRIRIGELEADRSLRSRLGSDRIDVLSRPENSPTRERVITSLGSIRSRRSEPIQPFDNTSQSQTHSSVPDSTSDLSIYRVRTDISLRRRSTIKAFEKKSDESVSIPSKLDSKPAGQNIDTSAQEHQETATASWIESRAPSLRPSNPQARRLNKPQEKDLEMSDL